MAERWRHSWRFRLIFWTVGGVWLFHFFVIALSLMPPNPLSHQYKLQIFDYMHPLFGQNWNLFAPNPINSNLSLLFKFKYYNGKEVHYSEWIDVMEPLINSKRTHFWSPAQRITKFMTASMQNVLESKAKLYEYISQSDSLSSDTTRAVLLFRRMMKRSTGHNTILQYSNYSFSKWIGTVNTGGIDSVFARYRIYNSIFPRFSKRKLNFWNLDYYEFKQSSSPYLKIR